MKACLGRGVIVGAVAALMLIAAVPAASAAVVVLGGGDPGEGYKPWPIPVYAYHFTHSTLSQLTDVIQGIPFVPFNWNNTGSTTVGSVTESGGSIYPIGAPVIGVSANDVALRDAAVSYFYSNGLHGSMTFILGGLTPGTAYQLDLIDENSQSSGNPPALHTIYSIQDANGTIVEDVPGVDHLYYNVRDTVVANALGRVIVTVTNNSGDSVNPSLNAFSITIPEPASAALTLIGITVASGGRRWRACGV